MEKIVWSYSHFKPLVKITDDYFKDYNKLKSRIFYKIVNYEKNREILKQIPHRRILDMAMVFYYQVDEVEPPATIMIQNSHLSMWDVKPEELEENAITYTCLCLPAEFLTMAQLAGMDEEDMKKPFVAVIGSFSEMVVEAHHFDAMVLLAQAACIGAMSFEKGTSNGSAFLLFEKIWFF